MGNSVLQTWRETGIQEKLENGVSAVRTKLTDPELQKEVKQKAQEAGYNIQNLGTLMIGIGGSTGRQYKKMINTYK